MISTSDSLVIPTSRRLSSLVICYCYASSTIWLICLHLPPKHYFTGALLVWYAPTPSTAPLRIMSMCLTSSTTNTSRITNATSRRKRKQQKSEFRNKHGKSRCKQRTKSCWLSCRPIKTRMNDLRLILNMESSNPNGLLPLYEKIRQVGREVKLQEALLTTSHLPEQLASAAL
jgi:hypothetical protein